MTRGTPGDEVDGGVNLSISLNLKLAPVPYASSEMPNRHKMHFSKRKMPALKRVLETGKDGQILTPICPLPSH